MADTTFYSAQEAVDNGFIDAIADADIKNTITWDVSAYHKTQQVDNSANKNNRRPKNDMSLLYRELALIEKSAA